MGFSDKEPLIGDKKASWCRPRLCQFLMACILFGLIYCFFWTQSVNTVNADLKQEMHYLRGMVRNLSKEIYHYKSFVKNLTMAMNRQRSEAESTLRECEVRLENLSNSNTELSMYKKEWINKEQGLEAKIAYCENRLSSANKQVESAIKTGAQDNKTYAIRSIQNPRKIKDQSTIKSIRDQIPALSTRPSIDQWRINLAGRQGKSGKNMPQISTTPSQVLDKSGGKKLNPSNKTDDKKPTNKSLNDTKPTTQLPQKEIPINANNQSKESLKKDSKKTEKPASRDVGLDEYDDDDFMDLDNKIDKLDTKTDNKIQGPKGGGGNADKGKMEFNQRTPGSSEKKKIPPRRL